MRPRRLDPALVTKTCNENGWSPYKKAFRSKAGVLLRRAHKARWVSGMGEDEEEEDDGDGGDAAGKQAGGRGFQEMKKKSLMTQAEAYCGCRGLNRWLRKLVDTSLMIGVGRSCHAYVPEEKVAMGGGGGVTYLAPFVYLSLTSAARTSCGPPPLLLSALLSLLAWVTNFGVMSFQAMN